ncbi:MAG: general secretion pathway protein GspK, partial [Myxococcales bacterium]|nr:general secretion pathway protein GspK [Myxococcales bacterium]
EIISGLVDWWDTDTTRTVFDPGKATVTTGGGEDNPYARYDDPYQIKNAPFDSLEEIRLVHGINDDFWATFVEPEPGNPISRKVTIYGSGSVNPNEGPPEVLLARLCSVVGDVSLCTDPVEAAKFVQLLGTARALVPVPFFTRSRDFLNFVEGKGTARDLYPLLQTLLGPNNDLLFKPIAIADRQMRSELGGLFVTAARLITVQSTGRVGRAEVRLTTIMNFHDRWVPPPPNAGSMPRLGIYHHYRVD